MQTAYVARIAGSFPNLLIITIFVPIEEIQSL